MFYKTLKKATWLIFALQLNLYHVIFVILRETTNLFVNNLSSYIGTAFLLKLKNILMGLAEEGLTFF